MIDSEQQRLLKVKYCPDGSVMRQVQVNLLDILVEFDRVCRKNGIEYWLDSGTLIGAMRHGGFIPWDDDVDVCILRKDYRRLLRCLEKDLKPPFRLFDYRKCSTADAVNHVPISRVVNESFLVSRRNAADGNCLYEPAWIDILPLENGNLFVKRLIEKTYGKLLRRKVFLIRDGKLRHLVSAILEPVSLPVCQLMRWMSRIFFKSVYIHDYGIDFKSVRMKNDIFPLKECEFEGKMFFCPNDSDSYLTRIYGDWKKIPDEANRVQHNFKICKKI